MIVERWTYPVKPGCQEAAVKIPKEETEANTPFKHSYRIYTPGISPQNVVVIEWEYEDLKDMQVCWDSWYAERGTPEFDEKWNKLIDGGGHRETWDLTEQR